MLAALSSIKELVQATGWVTVGRANWLVNFGVALCYNCVYCQSAPGLWVVRGNGIQQLQLALSSTSSTQSPLATYSLHSTYLQLNFHNYNINTAKGLAKQFLPRQFLADDKVGRFRLTGGSFDLRGKGCSPQHIFPQAFVLGRGESLARSGWSYLALCTRLLYKF